MRDRKIAVLFVLCFLFFIGVLNYPFIARELNKVKEAELVVDYDSKVDDTEDERRKEMIKEAADYNQMLFTGLPDENGLLSGEQHVDSAYYNLLNPHMDGIMGVVEIPKISVNIPIYHGTGHEVLTKGAGHLKGTSLPIGGMNTHASIAAHRGLPTNKFFTDLNQIKKGDIFYIRVLKQVLAYRVYETAVVKPEVTEPLKIEENKDLFTLITCTPYGINSHRIYVHGERIPYEEARKETQATGETLIGFLMQYWWVFLTAVLLVWMVVLLVFSLR